MLVHGIEHSHNQGKDQDYLAGGISAMPCFWRHPGYGHVLS